MKVADFLRKRLQRMAAEGGMDTPLVRWGMLLIVVIVLWAMVIAPFMAWRDEQADYLETRIARVERLLAMQQATDVWLKAQQQYAEAVKASAPAFIAGDSFAVAQSNMLTLLRQAVQQYHLTVESQHLAEPRLVDGLGQEIGIDLRLHGRLADVLAFMDALARHVRLLVADSVYIAPVAGQRSGDDMLLLIGVHAYRMAASSEAHS